MPEYVKGLFSDPAHGDSEQRFSDRSRLARLEAQADMLARELAECRAQLAAQAEAILRRAEAPATPVSPRRRTSSPTRRGGTFLRVVRVVVAAALGLAVIAAASGHRGQVRHRAARCTTSCQRPDGRQDRAADLR